MEVMRAHDIRWFLYNGGNDSADTALKLSQLGKRWITRSPASAYPRPSTTT